MSTVDLELYDDLVGVASARLAEAGVPRANRVRALRMLGILNSVADSALLVRQPAVDVAAEFEFPIDDARRAVDALEQVGVVHREGPLLRLTARETGVGGMRLIDFVELTEQQRRRRTVLGLHPVVAACAAALLLALGGIGSQIVRPARKVVRTAEGTPSANAATTDKRFPRGSIPSAVPDTVPVDNAGLPMVVPTPTSLVVLDCPTDSAPEIRVDGTAVDADGYMSVEGTATNDAPAPIEISGYTVSVALSGQNPAVTLVESPLVVPSGGLVRWLTRVAIKAAPGTPATVELDRWAWADATLRSRCPA